MNQRTCNENVSFLFANSPTVRTVVQSIFIQHQQAIQQNPSPNTPRPVLKVTCQPCNDATKGYFHPQHLVVVLCCDKLKNTADLEGTLVHELIHVYDHYSESVNSNTKEQKDGILVTKFQSLWKQQIQDATASSAKPVTLETLLNSLPKAAAPSNGKEYSLRSFILSQLVIPRKEEYVTLPTGKSYPVSLLQLICKEIRASKLGQCGYQFGLHKYTALPTQASITTSTSTSSYPQVYPTPISLSIDVPTINSKFSLSHWRSLWSQSVSMPDQKLDAKIKNVKFVDCVFRDALSSLRHELTAEANVLSSVSNNTSTNREKNASKKSAAVKKLGKTEIDEEELKQLIKFVFPYCWCDHRPFNLN
ncbi:hypothetical protein BKA69DRAFT_1040030 [Paraphysoderma sedebokerense]|nr:hypothetical protein BKA69DRAFT_1040030 [Paraphysoderma sedebokerense]